MQNDQPHAFPHTPGYALHDLVTDRTVILVPPPQKHVGVGQPLLGQAMFRLLQRRRRRLDRNVRVQRRRDGVVHPVRIDAPDHLIGLLMDILAPYDCFDRHGHSPCVFARHGHVVLRLIGSP
ncbi:hypothetical protein D3C71_1757900 [compost metagenome]